MKSTDISERLKRMETDCDLLIWEWRFSSSSAWDLQMKLRTDVSPHLHWSHCPVGRRWCPADLWGHSPVTLILTEAQRQSDEIKKHSTYLWHFSYQTNTSQCHIFRRRLLTSVSAQQCFTLRSSSHGCDLHAVLFPAVKPSDDGFGLRFTHYQLTLVSWWTEDTRWDVRQNETLRENVGWTIPLRLTNSSDNPTSRFHVYL